jgi:hypothetical protein
MTMPRFPLVMAGLTTIKARFRLVVLRLVNVSTQRIASMIEKRKDPLQVEHTGESDKYLTDENSPRESTAKPHRCAVYTALPP